MSESYRCLVGANIRKGAGTNYPVCGSIAKGGAYTIVAEKSGAGAKNGANSRAVPAGLHLITLQKSNKYITKSNTHNCKNIPLTLSLKIGEGSLLYLTIKQMFDIILYGEYFLLAMHKIISEIG